MWKRPVELHGRADVDMMVKGPPDMPGKKEETATGSDKEPGAKNLK